MKRLGVFLLSCAAAGAIAAPGKAGNELTSKAPTMSEQANAQGYTLERLRRQEQLLQFDSFSNATALDIGLKLVALAKTKERPVSVEIVRNGQVLFAHCTDGAPRDHADWIRRKSNLVNRTGRSSFHIHTQVVQKGGDIDAMPGFDIREYAAHGGSFPIVVKGTGQVGTITISGLPGMDDHEVVVAVLKDHLGIKEDI